MKIFCNKAHLCDSCIYEYPSCESEQVKFGNGKGNDNIVHCDCFNQGDNKFTFCPQDCIC